METTRTRRLHRPDGMNPEGVLGRQPEPARVHPPGGMPGGGRRYRMDVMARPTDDAQDREREARAVRRLLRSFRSIDSYGLLLLMIIATYVLATTLSERWGATVLLLAQIITVRWRTCSPSTTPLSGRSCSSPPAPCTSWHPYRSCATSAIAERSTRRPCWVRWPPTS